MCIFWYICEWFKTNSIKILEKGRDFISFEYELKDLKSSHNFVPEEILFTDFISFKNWNDQSYERTNRPMNWPHWYLIAVYSFSPRDFSLPSSLLWNDFGFLDFHHGPMVCLMPVGCKKIRNAQRALLLRTAWTFLASLRCLSLEVLGYYSATARRHRLQIDSMFSMDDIQQSPDAL